MQVVPKGQLTDQDAETMTMRLTRWLYNGICDIIWHDLWNNWGGGMTYCRPPPPFDILGGRVPPVSRGIYSTAWRELAGEQRDRRGEKQKGLIGRKLPSRTYPSLS